MSNVRAFLSYNSSDRLLAGNIKKHLESLGIMVFLAHQDIEPTEAWHDRILSELEKADVFLPLLTDDFEKSMWTGQECGYAVAKRTFVVSLKVTKDPPAFLSRKQAFRLKTSNLPASCLGVAKVIHKDSHLRRRFLDGLVDIVSRSESFEDAKLKTSLLDEFDEYSQNQINSVLKAAVENDQVWHSFGAQRHISSFVYRYRTLADKKLVERWRTKTR